MAGRSSRRIQCVFFDVDGVLVDVKSSWGYIHERLNVTDKAAEYMRLFSEGKIDYMEWMRLDTQLWIEASGGELHISTLKDILAEVGIREDARHVFRWLRRRGVRIALVSSGIDLLVRRVAEELGADAWVANRLEFDRRGYLKPGGKPIVGVDKSSAVKRLAWELGVDLSMSAYVGDSVWDISAMRVVGLPIALGEGEHSREAKAVISSLRELPRVIELWEEGLI